MPAVPDHQAEVVVTLRERGGDAQVGGEPVSAGPQLRSFVAAWRNTRRGFFGVSSMRRG